MLVTLPIGEPSEGFGIFSDGSRIAFLENNGLRKCLVYTGIIIFAVQAGACRATDDHFSLAGSDWVRRTVVSVFAISVIKTGAHLSLARFHSLADRLLTLRVSLMPVVAGFIAFASAFVVTANVMSEMLGISGIEC